MKITHPSGKFSIIATREEAGKSLPEISAGFEREIGKITRVSSTSEQPYVAANYDANGSFVGGSTLTEGMYAQLLNKANKEGWTVEE